MLTIKGINGSLQTDKASHKVKGTDNPLHFNHELYVHGGNLEFIFSNLLANHNYAIELGFAELFYQSSAKRIQNISINDKQCLSNLDICDEVGPFYALIKKVDSKANQNDELKILLETANNNCADICNIKIVDENIELLFIAGQTKLLVRAEGKVTEHDVSFINNAVK